MNQSGKTDFNLLQFEILHELGLGSGFGTNMKSVECDWIEHIDNFKDLKERCHMLNQNPGKGGIKRFFFLISELADFVPRDKPWNNVDFIKELQMVRKYGLSVISDSISRVDERVLNPNHFHGYFVKFKKGDPTVAKYYDWLNGRVDLIIKIPKTTIPFDTYESAFFYMEPQENSEFDIPLNQDHLIVKKYLESGCSIAKTGYHSQEVKRARDRVLDYHFRHCIQSLPSDSKDESDPIEP